MKRTNGYSEAAGVRQRPWRRLGAPGTRREAGGGGRLGVGSRVGEGLLWKTGTPSFQYTSFGNPVAVQNNDGEINGTKK